MCSVLEYLVRMPWIIRMSGPRQHFSLNIFCKASKYIYKQMSISNNYHITILRFYATKGQLTIIMFLNSMPSFISKYIPLRMSCDLAIWFYVQSNLSQYLNYTTVRYSIPWGSNLLCHNIKQLFLVTPLNFHCLRCLLCSKSSQIKNVYTGKLKKQISRSRKKK